MNDVEKHKISKDLKHLYALVGSITSTWSHIELLVDATIWSLANIDAKYGACITAQIQSLTYRLCALTAIVSLRGGSQDLIKSIKKFQNDAQDLASKRNRVVHDPISQLENEEPEVITITARRLLKFEFTKDKAKKYSAIDLKIARFAERYLLLQKNIYDEFEKRDRLAISLISTESPQEHGHQS